MHPLQRPPCVAHENTAALGMQARTISATFLPFAAHGQPVPNKTCLLNSTVRLSDSPMTISLGSPVRAHKRTTVTAPGKSKPRHPQGQPAAARAYGHTRTRVFLLFFSSAKPRPYGPHHQLSVTFKKERLVTDRNPTDTDTGSDTTSVDCTCTRDPYAGGVPISAASFQHQQIIHR